MRELKIPDEDNVLRRVIPLQWDRSKNKPRPSAFEPRPPGEISVEWERYITNVEEVRDRAAIAGVVSFEITKHNRVARLHVKRIRENTRLEVINQPTYHQAHSNIISTVSNSDLLQQRVFLADISHCAL